MRHKHTVSEYIMRAMKTCFAKDKSSDLWSICECIKAKEAWKIFLEQSKSR